MIRWLILRKISSQERKLGVPGCLDYVRQLFRVSPGGFWRFAPLASTASYRRALPAAAQALAHVVAAAEADCGTCVQISIHAAQQAGVGPDWIRAALNHDFDLLPTDLATVCRFTHAIVRADGQEETLRDDIRRRYGEAGLAELSMTIALAGVFPVMKRGMGYSGVWPVILAAFGWHGQAARAHRRFGSEKSGTRAAWPWRMPPVPKRMATPVTA